MSYLSLLKQPPGWPHKRGIEGSSNKEPSWKSDSLPGWEIIGDQGENSLFQV